MQVPEARRTAAQAAKLRLCFLERYAPEEMKAAWKNVLDLRESPATAGGQFSDGDGDAG